MPRFVILSDAGCYEVGNELAEDRRRRTTNDPDTAHDLFQEQCTYCENHIRSQLDIIENSEYLTHTSDYYWAVILIELPPGVHLYTDNTTEAQQSLLEHELLGEDLCKEAAGHEHAVMRMLEDLQDLV